MCHFTGHRQQSSIPEELRERIFECFRITGTTGDQIIVPVVACSSLGLSIVLRIAKLYDTEISLNIQKKTEMDWVFMFFPAIFTYHKCLALTNIIHNFCG